MILLLDLGNTRLKWALHDRGQWLAEGASAHHDGWDLQTLAEALRAGPALQRIIGSNVAGVDAAERLQQELDRLRGSDATNVEWLRSSAQAGGVRNAYLEPAQLGPDRWAALIGARARRRTATLVVSAGTATTVDILDRDGCFCGGLILPGLAMMRRALAGNTARLPYADGHFELQPRRTVDAIVSGCLQAQLGAIERMYRQIAAEEGAEVLLTGGAADALHPLLEMPVERAPRLVLEGLAVLAT